MRQVYPTDQIIHLWAHQAQESARNGSNVHFEGNALYSYSTTIAAIIDGVVYLSENNMAPTTARHISAARQATRHMEQFYTTAFSWSGSNPRLTHEAMIMPAARSAEKTLEYALSDSRTRKATKEKAILVYISEKQRITAHAARFNVKVDMPVMTAGPDAIKEYQEAKRIAEEKKEAARIKAQKKQQKEDAKTFKLWLTTGQGRCPYSFQERENDFITIKPHGDIQSAVTTSQGAECPLDHAVKALRFWESRKQKVTRPAATTPFTIFEPYHTNGHTIHLGAFKLDSIDEAGTVKAGCHTFTAKELQRFIIQWREVLGL